MTGSRRHDVAIVGGGVAGATLAYVLARGGLDVVVLERQVHQRDRVMGEAMAPWGVAEASAMDVFELMRPHGVVLDRVYSFESSSDSPVTNADESLREVVPGVPGAFGVSNPGLAAVMAGHAEAAGAEVVYSAEVRSVDPPSLVVEVDGTTRTVDARMIVGSDGKASCVRRALGIGLTKSGPHAQCAGMLAVGFGDGVPADAVTTGLDERSLRIVFPQGSDRARLYHMFRADRPNRANQLGFGTRVATVATNATAKLERYELTKRAINEGRVHSPEHQLLHDEALFVQRHGHQIEAPKSGPVVHDDYIDALTWLTSHLLGQSTTLHTALSELRISATDLEIFNRLSAIHHYSPTAAYNPARGIDRSRRGW